MSYTLSTYAFRNLICIFISVYISTDGTLYVLIFICTYIYLRVFFILLNTSWSKRKWTACFKFTGAWFLKNSNQLRSSMKTHDVEVCDFPWKLGLGYWSPSGLGGSFPVLLVVARKLFVLHHLLSSELPTRRICGARSVELMHTALTPDKTLVFYSWI